MGLTQYKRRQVQRHKRTLRTCGDCPITLLCFTGRIPDGVTICRCMCGLVYTTTRKEPTLVEAPLNLFKPFRCVQPVEHKEDGAYLLSGVKVFPRRCGYCSRLNLCAKCGKHMRPSQVQKTFTGQYVHWSCMENADYYGQTGPTRS